MCHLNTHTHTTHHPNPQTSHNHQTANNLQHYKHTTTSTYPSPVKASRPLFHLSYLSPFFQITAAAQVEEQKPTGATTLLPTVSSKLKCITPSCTALSYKSPLPTVSKASSRARNPELPTRCTFLSYNVANTDTSVIAHSKHNKHNLHTQHL